MSGRRTLDYIGPNDPLRSHRRRQSWLWLVALAGACLPFALAGGAILLLGFVPKSSMILSFAVSVAVFVLYPLATFAGGAFVLWNAKPRELDSFAAHLAILATVFAGIAGAFGFIGTVLNVVIR